MRAKKTGFPKASIEAAIARGQGLTSSGAKLESMIEEVMFPPSVAIIVDCMTDNKLRTKTEIRKALKDCGGGTLSSASYLFEKKGRISLRGREGLDLDTVLEPALEAGALDVEDGKDGGFIVYTQVSDLKSVSDALVQGLGVEVEDLRIIWDPQTRVDLDSGLIATQVDKFSCALNENPSVQDLYTNTTRRDHEAV
jgi:transcriptional/translational regulatory protein YebC/TACO1